MTPETEMTPAADLPVRQTGETPQEEPTTGQDAVDLDGLKAQLEQATAQASEFRAKYDTLSRTHQRAVEEGRISKSMADTLAALSAKIEDIELGQAALSDHISGSAGEFDLEDQPKTKASAVTRLQAERERKKLEREQQKSQTEQAEMAKMAIASAIEAAGYQGNEAIFQPAANKWSGGDYRASLEAVRQVISDEKGKKDMEKTRTQEAARKVAQQQQVKQSGALDVSTPHGTAPSDRWKQVRARFIEDPNDTANSEEYYGLRRERGL